MAVTGKCFYRQTGFYLEEGVEADGHPVGQHLLYNGLCPETHQQDRQTGRYTDRM